MFRCELAAVAARRIKPLKVKVERAKAVPHPLSDTHKHESVAQVVTNPSRRNRVHAQVAGLKIVKDHRAVRVRRAAPVLRLVERIIDAVVPVSNKCAS